MFRTDLRKPRNMGIKNQNLKSHFFGFSLKISAHFFVITRTFLLDFVAKFSISPEKIPM